MVAPACLLGIRYPDGTYPNPPPPAHKENLTKANTPEPKPIQLNPILADVSDIFYFFFCFGVGEGEAEFEAMGGGGLFIGK